MRTNSKGDEDIISYSDADEKKHNVQFRTKGKNEQFSQKILNNAFIIKNLKIQSTVSIRGSRNNLYAIAYIDSAGCNITICIPYHQGD